MLKGISKEQLGTLVADRIQKVEATFEKASGWKHRTIQDTLKNFSQLDRKSQLLFGGLLVTQAILPGSLSQKKPVKVKSRAAATEAAAHPTPNESAASASSGAASKDVPPPSVEVAAANAGTVDENGVTPLA